VTANIYPAFGLFNQRYATGPSAASTSFSPPSFLKPRPCFTYPVSQEDVLPLGHAPRPPPFPSAPFATQNPGAFLLYFFHKSLKLLQEQRSFFPFFPPIGVLVLTVQFGFCTFCVLFLTLLGTHPPADGNLDLVFSYRHLLRRISFTDHSKQSAQSSHMISSLSVLFLSSCSRQRFYPKMRARLSVKD